MTIKTKCSSQVRLLMCMIMFNNINDNYRLINQYVCCCLWVSRRKQCVLSINWQKTNEFKLVVMFKLNQHVQMAKENVQIEPLDMLMNYINHIEYQYVCLMCDNKTDENQT